MQLRKTTIALLAAGALGAGGFIGSHYVSASAAAPIAAAVKSVPSLSPTQAVALPNFASIVAQNGPAVVNISVSGTTRTATNDAPDWGDSGSDPFFKFFRGLPFQFQMPPSAEVPVQGMGSGFIMSPEGLILTNAHVVRNASEVTVKLTDRREFRAKVVGLDPETDVAVLRIDAKNLPTVRIGNAAGTQVGDWVVAIGSPFGFENSVTAGIVSAKSRALPGDAYVPFIQTDVAVNPGNSGGPLFNLAGEVIGINSQIYSRTGGYQGLSFAIPIDVAQRVMDQIVSTGHARHARLGVMIQEVNQPLAESFGLEKAHGALVSSVQPDSAAARAGLKTGDVILKFNGRPITSSGDLPSLVSQSKPGSRATLEVWRKGERQEISAVLGESERVATEDAVSGQTHGRLGLSVRPLTGEEKSQVGVSGGLLVEGVDGPARKAGMQPGDIILSVNGTQIKSVDQLREMAKPDKRTLALLVQRGEARVFVPVTIG